MNSRKRYTKKVGTEFPLTNTKKARWTNEEKEALLSALNKHGCTDIDNISKEIPSKTKGAIRTMINKQKLAAQAAIHTRENHIDGWLRSGMFAGPDTLISQAFKYISMFEKHPEPEECAGCDFRALYDLLSRVTAGNPPVNVSKMTYETICYVMSQVNHEVWPFYEKEVSQYLENLEEQKIRKCYTRSSSSFQNSTIKKERK